MKEFYRFSVMAASCSVLLLLSAHNAYSQTMTPRYITTSVNSHGFYEYLPAGYSSSGSQTYPLLFFFQGVGEHGNGTSDLSKVLDNGTPHLISIGQFPTSFTVNGKTYSFIIITPQWVNTPSQVTCDSLIQYVLANYKVDTNRIYLTGLSEGGALAWAYPGYSSVFAGKVAAVLPVCGGYALNAAEAQNVASGNVAVFGTHNSDDSSVSDTFTIDNVKAINSTNPPPSIAALDTIFPDPGHNGHNAWLVTYDPTANVFESQLNAYQWMLQNARKTTVNTLPVTITAYTATVTQDGNAVDIDWTTSRETNNSYFILQRSGDGTRFINLDTIPAANPQGIGHSYIYRDKSPLPGNNFYRLRQVDINGAMTVFGTLEVSITGPHTQGLQAGPNPCNGVLNLHLVNADIGETISLNLRDLQGNLLRTWQFGKPGTTWSQSIDLGSLPAGAYVLQVNGKTTSIVRTIIKE